MKKKRNIFNPLSATVWNAFEKTGNVGYYLLYKKLTKKKED